MDPWDIEAMDSGLVYVNSGSGQWTHLRVFEAATGAQRGAWYGARQATYLRRAPDQRRIYGVDTDVSPRDVEVWHIPSCPDQSAPIASYDSIYHGEFLSGADPLCITADGLRALTTGGLVLQLSSEPEQYPPTTDMRILHDYFAAGTSTWLTAENWRGIYAPSPGADPSIVHGFTKSGLMARLDLRTFTAEQHPGYDVATLGLGRDAAACHRRGVTFVVTDAGRLVVVPLPSPPDGP